MKNRPNNIIRRFSRPAAFGAAVVLSLLSPAGVGMWRCAAGNAAETAAGEGAEVLTRGPVHEAFAETITFKPTAGIFVPKAPPDLIEELPPDQRPEGDNVTWIPGYWAWDDEANDFLWVSGIWRNLPPGRQWVPGYWNESGKEYQWISGYWADAAAEEVEYLPEPRPSIEAGPNIAAPSEDHTWIPGTWVWSDTRYRWRAGYWDLARPDWVWVPAHYVWTPRGYIFVDGYWDYAVGRWGMIFAPVHFAAGYYNRPNYHYCPSTVINLALFVDSLFLRPRCHHYYFGDYYAPEYRRSGYYGYHTYYSGGHGYDPIFAHERWMHRHEDHWERRVEENFAFYREHQEERPPRTLVAFQQFQAKPDKLRRVDPAFVTPLGQLATRKDNTVKLKVVDESERQKMVQHGREIRDFSDQQKKFAKTAPDAVVSDKRGKGEPARVKAPRSPVFSKVTDQSAKEDTPPTRPQVTIPDDKSGEKPGNKSDRGNRPGDKPKLNPDDEPSIPPGGRKPKFDPKDDPKREPKTDPGGQPKREPKMDPRDLPKREPKTEPGDIPKHDPKIEPKDTPKREPKVEPKREPKTEPKMEPKREPRVEPKTEPKREPKNEPKREPKVEPRDVPKREPKMEPHPQPKFEPRPQPKPPSTDPGKGHDKSDDKNKDKDKDKPRKP